MRHLRKRLLAALVALLIMPGLPIAIGTAAYVLNQPAAATSVYAPVIRTPFKAMADPVKIVNHDLGFINGVNMGGTFYVAYQLRPEGQVIVATHTVTGLIPLDDVSLVLSQALSSQGETPNLALPGPKQGSVSLVQNGQLLRIYFTGREEGDPTGPFYGWYWDIDPTP